MSANSLEKLNKLAAERGLKVITRGVGHIQIAGGPLLVNYYPGSKKNSAYIAGTTSKKTNVTPEQAIEMAFSLPDSHIKASRRRKGYRQIKIKMLKKSSKCNWCRKVLTIDTATLDHIIPISRGGLDNANNWCLACEPCNKSRGNEMPELNREAAR